MLLLFIWLEDLIIFCCCYLIALSNTFWFTIWWMFGIRVLAWYWCFSWYASCFSCVALDTFIIVHFLRNASLLRLNQSLLLSNSILANSLSIFWWKWGRYGGLSLRLWVRISFSSLLLGQFPLSEGLVAEKRWLWTIYLPSLAVRRLSILGLSRPIIDASWFVYRR